MVRHVKQTDPIRRRLGRTGQYILPELTLGVTSVHVDADPPQAGFAWHQREDGVRGTVRLGVGESTVVAGRRVTLIEVDGGEGAGDNGGGGSSVVVEIGVDA